MAFTLGRKMKIINYRKAGWFLFADDKSLLLDVNCNLGCFGYSWMVELNETERKNYEEKGTSYLDQLAEAIHNSVPIHKETTSPYSKRDVSKKYEIETTQAFEEWKNMK